MLKKRSPHCFLSSALQIFQCEPRWDTSTYIIKNSCARPSSLSGIWYERRRLVTHTRAHITWAITFYVFCNLKRTHGPRFYSLDESYFYGSACAHLAALKKETMFVGWVYIKLLSSACAALGYIYTGKKICYFLWEFKTYIIRRQWSQLFEFQYIHVMYYNIVINYYNI